MIEDDDGPDLAIVHPAYLERDAKIDWFTQLCFVVRDSATPVDCIIIGQEIGLDDAQIEQTIREVITNVEK